jgi:hypothetical protein
MLEASASAGCGRRPAGRRSAEACLAKAEALDPSDGQLAAILGVRGMNASDMGDYPGAFRHLERSVGRAARGDMRELVVRAHLHRGRLGDPTALASARLLAAGIDNPALDRLLDGARG